MTVFDRDTSVIEREYQNIKNQYMYKIVEVRNNIRWYYAIVIGVDKGLYDIEFLYTPVCGIYDDIKANLHRVLSSAMVETNCFVAFSVMPQAIGTETHLTKCEHFSIISNCFVSEQEIQNWVLKNKLVNDNLFLDFD